jgi:hypothetical protein
MRKRIEKCKKCGKEIRLFYTGNHESYKRKQGIYHCEGCMYD